MRKFIMAWRHMKDHYPIVWRNWDKSHRRYMVREFLWFSHVRGNAYNLNRFED